MKAYVIDINGKAVVGHDGSRYLEVPVTFKKSIGHSPAIKSISIEKEFALVLPSRAVAQEIMDNVKAKFENCKVDRVSMDMGNTLNLKSFKFSTEWLWNWLASK